MLLKKALILLSGWHHKISPSSQWNVFITITNIWPTVNQISSKFQRDNVIIVNTSKKLKGNFYRINDSARKQRWLAFSMKMKIQNNFCITAHWKVIIHPKYLQKEKKYAITLFLSVSSVLENLASCTAERGPDLLKPRSGLNFSGLLHYSLLVSSSLTTSPCDLYHDSP